MKTIRGMCADAAREAAAMLPEDAAGRQMKTRRRQEHGKQSAILYGPAA